MKRFLLTGLLILGLGQFATYAQQRGTYNDDIYYNSKDAQKEADARKQRAAEAAAAREAARAQEEQERENTYSSSGDEARNTGRDAETYRRSYESDADGDGYLDANDDYYYTSRVRRFSYNSWGGYYSPFYDPFWYGPGFYGPGYYGSGVTVSIGYGWGPGWGYGPGWGACGPWGPAYGWGYPYGYGYGYPYGYGYGYPYYGYGYGAGYNHGFYDGYHYGGGGFGGPRAVYGPRSSVSSNSYGPRAGRGGTLPSSGGLIRQQRTSGPDGGSVISTDPRSSVRSSRELPDRAIQNPGNGAAERSRRFEPSEPAAQQQMQERRMQRNRIFGGGQIENSRRIEQREQPAYEQRQQRSYEPQRYQQSAPSRMQSSPSPSMGSPRGGGSFGGGGGSFGSGGGGGRRR